MQIHRAAFKNKEISLDQYLAIYNALTGRWARIFTSWGNSGGSLLGYYNRKNEELGATYSANYGFVPTYGYTSWKSLNEYEKLRGTDFNKMDEYTQTGVIWGIMSGATPRFGPEGTVLVEGVLPSSDTARRMSMFDATGITFGNVILTKESPIRVETLAHEMEHVKQYRKLVLISRGWSIYARACPLLGWRVWGCRG